MRTSTQCVEEIWNELREKVSRQHDADAFKFDPAEPRAWAFSDGTGAGAAEFRACDAIPGPRCDATAKLINKRAEAGRGTRFITVRD